MGQLIKISVSSNIPGMVIQNVELEVEQRKVGMSWHAFLVDRGLKQIDPEKMMIRSTGGRIMSAPSEPIRNFLNQYKKRVKIYRVQIVKTNARTRGQLNERRQNFKRELLEEMSSSSPPGGAAPPPAQTARKIGVIRRSGEHPGAAAAAGRKKVKFDFSGHGRYPEDDPNFAPPVTVGDVEESDVDIPDDGDNDDNASLCSQDSQDPGFDVKTRVVQRFQNSASDGDIQRIIGELAALKRKQRVLKVSRYIPHTMNLLNIIFEPQIP